jgi:hypothetical protein
MEALLKKQGYKFSFPKNRVVSIVTVNENVGSAIAGIVDNGFKILDTEVDKPTLEDVFLQIARKED